MCFPSGVFWTHNAICASVCPCHGKSDYGKQCRQFVGVCDVRVFDVEAPGFGIAKEALNHYLVGRLQGFELIRDTMRKRGLHLMLIFQSIAQLEETYQKTGARAWNNSVAARVYAATDDNEDQAAISRMIGEYTVDIEARSTSTGMRGFGIGTPTDNRTKSVNLQKASLMRPEQVRTLEADGLLVFFKGQNPMICGKALSYRREEWQHVTPFRPGSTETGQDGKGGAGERVKGMVKDVLGKKQKDGQQGPEKKSPLSKLAMPRKRRKP